MKASSTKRRLSRLSAIHLKLLGIALTLIILLGGAGTYALLHTAGNTVINSFSSASSGIEVKETLEGNTKKDVFVLNTGTAPVYVRAVVIPSWISESDENQIHSSVPDIALTDQSDWISRDEDGLRVYYYTKIVPGNGKTSNLIDAVTPVEDAPDGYTLDLDIIAQSVQASPADLTQNSWNVVIDSNGFLTNGGF